jgi:hypothetical protein
MASAGGIRAGKAYVEMSADNSTLQRGLRQAEASLKAWGASIATLGAKLSAVGGSITAPFLAAAKGFADFGSTLADTSARTGVSVETLSALGYAAEMTGSSLGDVENGVRRMQKALTDGSLENQQAAQTFAQLGLSIEELVKLTPDQQFAKIAKAIAAIPNPTAKAGAAMQIFGKSGTLLVPMIDDLESLTTEAKSFNLVWTGEEADKADALGDAFDLLTKVVSRTVAVVGSALAPALTDVLSTFAGVAKYAIEFAQNNQQLISTVFKVGVAVAGAGAAIVALGGAISGAGVVAGTLASAVGVVGTGLAALLSPIGLVVGGVAGLAIWLAKTSDVGQQALAFLGGAFDSVRSVAIEAFGGIANALKTGDISLAGKILWAGLKVTFLEGTNYLRALWADWGTATIAVARSVQYKVSGYLTEIWSSVKTGVVNATSGAEAIWTTFVNGLASSINSFAGIIRKVAAQIKGFFTGADVDAEIKRITEEVEAANRAQEQVRQDQLAEVGKSNLKSTGQIEADRQQAQAALADQQEAANDATRREALAGIAKGAADLLAAQKELAALTGQAAKKAGESATAIKPKLPKAIEGLEDRGIPEAVQEVKSKVDVAGSFSGLNLAGLSAGSSVVEQDQLASLKGIEKQMDRLNHAAQIGRLVFS